MHARGSPVLILWLILILVSLISGCSGRTQEVIATPLPASYLPTAVALTLAARGIGSAAQAATSTDALPATAATTEVPAAESPTFARPPAVPTLTETVAAVKTSTTIPAQSSTPFTVVFTATNTVPVPPTLMDTATATPPTVFTPAATITQSFYPNATLTISVTSQRTQPVLPATPTLGFSNPTGLNGSTTPTPAPAIPDANIAIYRLGEHSMVVSPIEVSVRMVASQGKLVRIELYGEDGRLLARYVRPYTEAWDIARLATKLDYEISAAGELGRLVISVEDNFGRLLEVNSVDLILLSKGMTDLTPATAVWQRIIIEEPLAKALIQGGKLIVSGRALPSKDQPLKAVIIGEDGKILGQRLAAVTRSNPGDYGTFIAEVPYSVTDLTQALLVIYEDGGPISTYTLLTSQPIILAP
jgi:hypothetical protein